ncbi:MAG: hypothetical protein IPO21_15920 [Bacteroidales bacterium]|nr:hypothetical protein [Bacteroidales bacterium]
MKNPIKITNVDDFEVSVSTFKNYEVNAVDVVSRTHQGVRIDSCVLQSPFVMTGFSSDCSKVQFTYNKMNAGKMFAVKMQGDSLDCNWK